MQFEAQNGIDTPFCREVHDIYTGGLNESSGNGRKLLFYRKYHHVGFLAVSVEIKMLFGGGSH